MSTAKQKTDIRKAIADFCQRAENNRLRWHYTQARPAHGHGQPPEVYHAADCSIYVSLACFWAQLKTGVHIADPLGEGYNGWGYTGTEYLFLKKHTAPDDKYLVGDIALWGTASRTIHTSICRKSGTSNTAIFSSNGHESVSPNYDAPNPTTIANQGLELVGVYRHPALL